MSVSSRLASLVTRLREPAEGSAIPFANAADLRPAALRSRLLRGALVVAVVAAVVVAAAEVPAAHGKRFLPADTVGIVVLDLSSSVRPATWKQIGYELDRLSRTDQRFGVVYFSDVAYEALPPGTPAVELRPVARFFQATKLKRDATGSPLPRTPWEQWFSAGTSISSGLLLAADLLQRDHVKRSGVVLFSDLQDDPSDLRALGRAMSRYDKQGISLRVVALAPTPEDSEFWVQLLGRPGAMFNVGLPSGDAGRGRLLVEGTLPVKLAILAGIVMLLLTLNVYFTQPISWRRSV